jgi:integrase/recombinase XerD
VKYPVNDRLILMRPPEGPLAALIRPFSDWAAGQGYALAPLRQRVRLAADLSRWLGKHALQGSDIHVQHFAQYLRYRRRRRSMLRGDAFALDQFRDYLCQQGVVAPEGITAGSITAARRCAQEFERYLREERLLAAPTIITYMAFAGEFLKDRFGTGPVDLIAAGREGHYQFRPTTSVTPTCEAGKAANHSP